MKKIIIILSIFLFSPLTNALANSPVEQFAFKTDPQTITIGEISKEIIIESQDSTGNPVAPNETVDLKFLSDSATGEFLNESGGPISTIMNKNWKTRTFFYRDSNPGTHILKIEATGRDSQRIWTASQQIIISAIGTENQSAGSQPNDQQPTSENIISTTQNTGFNSPISEQNSNLSADAGENIIALINKEITFDASKSQGASKYEWNFGDGQTSKEKVVKHKYSFPGKYIAVLTVSDDANSSQSQITATIYPSGVYINEFLPSPVNSDDEWIEIYNSNNFPVNLSDWKIKDSSTKSFIIPQNTFIAPQNYLVLTKQITKLSLNNDTDSVKLFYPEDILIEDIGYQKSKIGYSASRTQDGSFAWSQTSSPGQLNIFSNETSLKPSSRNSQQVSESNTDISNKIINNSSNVVADSFISRNLITVAKAQTVQENIIPEYGIENPNHITESSITPTANISKYSTNKNIFTKLFLILATMSIFALMWRVMKKN